MTGGRSGEATNWPGLQNSGLKGQLHLRLRGGEDQRQGGQGAADLDDGEHSDGGHGAGVKHGPQPGLPICSRRTENIINHHWEAGTATSPKARALRLFFNLSFLTNLYLRKEGGVGKRDDMERGKISK